MSYNAVNTVFHLHYISYAFKKQSFSICHIPSENKKWYDKLKKILLNFLKITAFTIILANSNQLLARDYIQMAGSSTVYPFATVIAEEFGSNTGFKTPIVESIGTGAGFKLFCSGIGDKYIDFSNASRQIKAGEVTRCKNNNIQSIIEIKIGYDGIIIANSVKSSSFSAIGNNLSKEQIFLALADKIPDQGTLIKNPYEKWSDIDESLPDQKIEVYGPPPTSGTRDAFVELVMQEACTNIKEFVQAYPDKNKRQKACHIIRTDGKFIEAGENDNLIVHKLKINPNALGIFGFSSLQQNSNIIRGFKIDRVSPAFINIASGRYPVSRPLFIYAKGEHLDIIPGMREFIKEILSTDLIGEDGYLLEKGLIPMENTEHNEVSYRVLKSL